MGWGWDFRSCVGQGRTGQDKTGEGRTDSSVWGNRKQLRLLTALPLDDTPFVSTHTVLVSSHCSIYTDNKTLPALENDWCFLQMQNTNRKIISDPEKDSQYWPSQAGDSPASYPPHWLCNEIMLPSTPHTHNTHTNKNTHFMHLDALLQQNVWGAKKDYSSCSHFPALSQVMCVYQTHTGHLPTVVSVAWLGVSALSLSFVLCHCFSTYTQKPSPLKLYRWVTINLQLSPQHPGNCPMFLFAGLMTHTHKHTHLISEERLIRWWEKEKCKTWSGGSSVFFLSHSIVPSHTLDTKKSHGEGYILKYLLHLLPHQLLDLPYI